jgi:hypothetical protein
MKFGLGRQWNLNPLLPFLNKNFVVQHTDVQNLKKPRNNETTVPHSRCWGTLSSARNGKKTGSATSQMRTVGMASECSSAWSVSCGLVHPQRRTIPVQATPAHYNLSLHSHVGHRTPINKLQQATKCIYLLHSKPTHALPLDTLSHPHFKTLKFLKMFCKHIIKTLHVSVTTIWPASGVVFRT